MKVLGGVIVIALAAIMCGTHSVLAAQTNWVNAKIYSRPVEPASSPCNVLDTDCLTPTKSGFISSKGTFVNKLNGKTRQLPTGDGYIVPIRNTNAAYTVYPSSSSVSELVTYTPDATVDYPGKPIDPINGPPLAFLTSPQLDSISTTADGRLYMFSLDGFLYQYLPNAVHDKLLSFPRILFVPQQTGVTSNMFAMASNSDDSWRAVTYSQANNSLGVYIANTACFLGPYEDCRHQQLYSALTAMVPNYHKSIGTYFNQDDNPVIKIELNDGSIVYQELSLSQFTPAGYLGLGDSFASGEGAYAYINGTDKPDNKCHTSRQSYPLLLGATASYACSGAKMRDVIARTQYPGDTYELPGSRPQINQVARIQPAAVTLSIGGNDIGFADIIKSCIDPRTSLSVRATCFATYEERLQLLRLIVHQFPLLIAEYRQLLTASPASKLYVVGYPRIISTDNACFSFVQLNQAERLFADQLTVFLNKTIEAAARSAGVFYVDASNAFDGHQLCDFGLQAVNGITFGDDSVSLFGKNIVGQESFHPNAYGHQLLAQLIAQATNNLHAPMPVPAPDSKPPSLKGDILNVPHANTTLNALYYNNQIAQDVIDKRSPFKIIIDGLNGLLPKSPVTVLFRSEPIIAAQLTTDGQGELLADVLVPSSLGAGYHMLHILGTDNDGDPVDIFKAVYLYDDTAASVSANTATSLAITQTAVMRPGPKIMPAVSLKTISGSNITAIKITSPPIAYIVTGVCINLGLVVLAWRRWHGD